MSAVPATKKSIWPPLWVQVVIALIGGVAAGLAMGPQATPVLGWLGDIYINLIKMLIVPLVFLSVTTSLSRLGQTGKALRLGAKTLMWFILTSMLAVAVGLGVGLGFAPWFDVAGLVAEPVKAREIPTVTEVLTNLAPSNIFAAFTEGKVLQVLVISALVGAALMALGERAARLRAVLEDGATVIFAITRWIIRLTPIGVFALIAGVVGEQGLAALLPLGNFILAVAAACAIHILVVYGGLLKLHGLSARRFFGSAFTAQQTAFATSSSMATVPVSLSVVTDKLGVDRSYAGFAVPLGANMKMDACGAIFPAIASIFIARFYGIPLDIGHYGIIAFTAVLGTLATAGVPGTAIVMLSLTLGAAGLPLEGIGLLAAVDRVVDMIRTMTNVTGQMLVPYIVAKEEGLITEPERG